MRIYKRGESTLWWISWTDQNGKRHRRSSGTKNKREAEALAATWVKKDFLAEHLGIAPYVGFNEALLRYAKVNKRDHPRGFMRSTRYRLEHLKQHFGHLSLSEITLRVIEDYMDMRLETVTHATAQKDVSILRAILNRAYREGLVEKAPRIPKFRPVKARCRWLTAEEEARLVASAPKHLKPIVVFAVETGGRLSEILRLDWRDVNFPHDRFTFRDTKNGEDRTIRLTDRARATLTALGVKDSGPVFTFRGKPMKTVKTSFEKARTLAGLEDVRFHDLRHTFASRLVQGGVPLYDVMHLTGHKSLEMVQRYSHLAPDYQDRAIGALNAFGHSLSQFDTVPPKSGVQ